MSTGDVKTPSQPVRTGITWTSRVSSIILAALIAGQQFGLLTPQNAATIKQVNDQLVPIADRIETAIVDKKLPDAATIVDLANQVKKLIEQLQQVKPKPEPTPTPIHVDPVPSPDQQKIADMQEQIRKLMDELAKKHEPPAPVPVPPASIKVVDSSGKPVADPIEAGKQFKVVASVAGKWAITSESPTADYDVMEYPDHLVCVLRNSAKLSISHATEAPLTLTAIMVKCKDAPRPPPTPVDPVEPDKPKLGMRVLMLYESSQNHSAKQDLILNSFTTGKINDAVVSRVTKDADGRPNWRRWDIDLNVDTSSTMGKLFAETKPKAVQRGLPALVIALGDDATIYKIPPDANEDQVLAAIEGAK